MWLNGKHRTWAIAMLPVVHSKRLWKVDPTGSIGSAFFHERVLAVPNGHRRAQLPRFCG
jgi:hypothetical protein